jgi:ribosome-associated toxin RatA of RatAB toxin-antitoxin module
MHTVDEIVIAAPVAACFRAAADVERWPDFLEHYRWVRFHRKDGFGRGRVEMAARRDFGRLHYPVWWLSEMTIDEDAPVVTYRHVGGVTTGMDVVWSFEPEGEGQTRVRLVHDWEVGPEWPLPKFIRRRIATHVIGPRFISHVAGRTLAGVRRRVEAAAAGMEAA